MTPSRIASRRVEYLYRNAMPVMGSPYDTPDGHGAAFSSAQVQAAREALRSYQLGHTHLLTFLSSLERVLTSKIMEAHGE